MGRHRTRVIFLVAFVMTTSGCDEVKARRHIQEGNKLYNAGKYEDSVKRFETALSTHPELDVGWYNLGLAHRAAYTPGVKDPRNDAHAEGAIKAFELYISRHPDDSKARDYMLSTYVDSGRYEGAIAYFMKQVEKDPKDVAAIGQIAKLSADAGKFDQAVEWHRRRAAVESGASEKADAFLNIGILTHRRVFNKTDVAGDKRLELVDQGLAALEEALRLRPAHAQTLTWTNLLYRQRAAAHDTTWARMIELASAQIRQKKSQELQRQQQGTPPAAPTPPAPPTPPNPPAPK